MWKTNNVVSQGFSTVHLESESRSNQPCRGEQIRNYSHEVVSSAISDVPKALLNVAQKMHSQPRAVIYSSSSIKHSTNFRFGNRRARIAISRSQYVITITYSSCKTFQSSTPCLKMRDSAKYLLSNTTKLRDETLAHQNPFLFLELSSYRSS